VILLPKIQRKSLKAATFGGTGRRDHPFRSKLRQPQRDPFGGLG